MSDARHARLLLAVLQQRWAEAERLVAGAALDPARFVGLCVQCDVPGWIHARLSDDERAGLLGDEVRERLRPIRERVGRDNMLLLARAEQAIDALLGAGIVPVALKGLDLLHRAYRRIDERTLDDVDLLVDPAELPAALAALRAAGWSLPPQAETTHYVRSSHHLPLRSPGALPVELELHWGLAQDLRFRVDTPGLLRRARPLAIAGRPVRRLEDHDYVAHLLLHHFTHYFDRRLKWAVDLRAVSARPGFDWDAVAERARAWGASAVSAMALRHLAKTVPDWIPPRILELLPVRAWTAVATWPLRSSHPLDLFRGAARRSVRLYLAAALLEHPGLLPRWLAHRALRDRRPSDHPLDSDRR